MANLSNRQTGWWTTLHIKWNNNSFIKCVYHMQYDHFHSKYKGYVRKLLDLKKMTLCTKTYNNIR